MVDPANSTVYVVDSTNAGVSEIATGVQDHGGFYVFGGNPAPILDDIAINSTDSTLYVTNTYAANAGFFDNGTVTVINIATGEHRNRAVVEKAGVGGIGVGDVQGAVGGVDRDIVQDRSWVAPKNVEAAVVLDAGRDLRHAGVGGVDDVDGAARGVDHPARSGRCRPQRYW